MFSNTLTIAMVVFIPALELLFISFYRCIPGACAPGLRDGEEPRWCSLRC
jgi:hypothetical protein